MSGSEMECHLGGLGRVQSDIVGVRFVDGKSLEMSGSRTEFYRRNPVRVRGTAEKVRVENGKRRTGPGLTGIEP